MDILENYSYNLKVARVFGVNSAVFLSCLEDETRYEERNNKLKGDTISLSRAEIYERTAIDDGKQKQVELALSECGVITVKPLQNSSTKNYYTFNKAVFEKIITSEDPTKVIQSSSASKFVKKHRVEPKTKRQVYIETLKRTVKEEDPVVKQYYMDWIDAVYTNPRGFLSPAAIRIAEEELFAYTKGSQEKLIAILKIAIKGGLRELTWAINRYEEQNPEVKTGTRNFNDYHDIQVDKSNMSEEAF